MSNRTFTMIKPDAMEKGYAGAIIDRILKEGFRLVAMKLTHLTPEKAGEFYAIHKEKPFYGELIAYMSVGQSSLQFWKRQCCQCFPRVDRRNQPCKCCRRYYQKTVCSIHRGKRCTWQRQR